MYLSCSILIAFAAAMSQAAPLQQDSTSSRIAHLTSRDEIQNFLQEEARDQFMMFDSIGSSRKDDENQDLPPLPLHLQTRHHARPRRDADCSTYPPELQIFCFSVYGDDYYSDEPTDTPPLKFDEVIGIDNLDSSQTGWTA